MRQNALPLLSALVLLLAAAGGAVAADAGTVGSSEETTEESPDEIDSNDTQNSSAEVGICVVGVDSPCNGDSVDGDGERGERIGDGESDAAVDVGVCVVGADSPCNGDTAENRTHATHPTPVDGGGESGARSGAGDGRIDAHFLSIVSTLFDHPIFGG